MFCRLSVPYQPCINIAEQWSEFLGPSGTNPMNLCTHENHVDVMTSNDDGKVSTHKLCLVTNYFEHGQEKDLIVDHLGELKKDLDTKYYSSSYAIDLY